MSMKWSCPVCHELIEAVDTLVLDHKIFHLQVAVGMFDDRISELEKQVNRVPGSIPGDYTWDELVGKRDD